MRLDHAWIERHIPHQGRMCLLDEVIRWDAGSICCRSGTHRLAGHPLLAHGRVGVACGIEYAAQSMAVHGALLAGAAAAARSPAPDSRSVDAVATRRPAAGFLASVRGVRLHVLRLDDLPHELICESSRVAGDGAGALYEFEVRSAAVCVLSGRATVVLDATQRLTP